MKQNVRFQGRMQHKINQLDQIQKWPFVCYYLLEVTYARYLVNRARWLDNYCITKREVSGENVS